MKKSVDAPKGYHWMKAEEDYPVHYFIREINEGSLN